MPLLTMCSPVVNSQQVAIQFSKCFKVFEAFLNFVYYFFFDFVYYRTENCTMKKSVLLFFKIDWEG